MSAPLTTLVGEDLYDAVAPLTGDDEALGWPLATYCDVNGLMLDEEARLVRVDDAGNDGWSSFADPQRCPDSYLYTLAQWAGVRYPRRMSYDELRALIGPTAPGLWRGTRAAITASVQRYLSDDGLLYFEERAGGDAYALRIFTYTYNTGANEAAIRAELAQVIPAGLILDYEVRSGQSYAMVAQSGATYAQVRASYVNYTALASFIPH